MKQRCESQLDSNQTYPSQNQCFQLTFRHICIITRQLLRKTPRLMQLFEAHMGETKQKEPLPIHKR